MEEEGGKAGKRVPRWEMVEAETRAEAAVVALRSGLVLDVKGQSSRWDVLLTDGAPGVTGKPERRGDRPASGVPSQVFQLFT